ncbi:MAG: type II toxin-antitoxin system VapC family toxin [Pseudomonadota bacterium]
MVNIYVADASVVIKWYVPEIHSEAARRLRKPAYRLHVPDFFLLEFGNVVCKKLRRGDITRQLSNTMINDVQTILLKWHKDEPLFSKAFEIANETKRSLYDCLYLSLAVSLDAQMVTADLRLYNALKDGDYGSRLLWVEDIP